MFPHPAVATTRELEGLERLLNMSDNSNLNFTVNNNPIISQQQQQLDTDGFVDEDLVDDLYDIATDVVTPKTAPLDALELFSQLLADNAQHHSAMAMHPSNGLGATTTTNRNESLLFPVGDSSMMMMNNSTVLPPSLQTRSAHGYEYMHNHGGFILPTQHHQLPQSSLMLPMHQQQMYGLPANMFSSLMNSTTATTTLTPTTHQGYNTTTSVVGATMPPSHQHRQLLAALLLTNPAQAMLLLNQVNDMPSSTAVSTTTTSPAAPDRRSVHHHLTAPPPSQPQQQSNKNFGSQFAEVTREQQPPTAPVASFAATSTTIRVPLLAPTPLRTTTTTTVSAPTSALVETSAGATLTSATKTPAGSNPGTAAPPTPLRALSAYNFFFRDERERILNGSGDDDNDANMDWSVSRQEKLLQSHWTRDRTVKRRHRKTHGKISFATLSKRISQRWKELPESQKIFFGEVAAKDWERYHRELAKQKMGLL
jgi:HMG (high mobility group) box